MADKLAKYRSMRDFSRTAEPAGADSTKASKRLRFVIQKHAATRLHYDFRLELDGVFLSWAVTKGPSLNPADRRLAVQTEDHPLDYGDFEGTIPKGQYGGGTVMLWDRGYWEPEGDPKAMLKKGDLKFTLDGERLKGSWVLVRMKRREREKRDNWLLIKHRDGWSLEDQGELLVEGETTSVASGRSMEEIEAGKGKGPTKFMTGKGRAKAADVWQSNRDTGDAARPSKVAAEKASPAPRLKAAGLPGFVPPQLAKSVDRPPPGAGWAHEIKFDGYRLQLRVEKGKATLKTRKGLDWTAKFKEIAADAAALPDGVYDGEACALDHNGSPDFPALQAALSDGKTQDLVFFAFDVLFLEGEDLREAALRDRKARLESTVEAAGKKIERRIRYVAHFETAGDAVLQSACRMSLEGIVSKRMDAPYRSDRTDTWQKSKCRAGHEVVIGGWTGEAGQLRSLLVGVHRGDKLVYVGRVGTGFGRDKVARVLPRLEAVRSETRPFSGPGAPRKEANVQWARPDLVAEIEFAGFTGGGQVRQGSFKGLREDKPAAEVEAETPARTELAEPEPKAGPKIKAKPAGKAPPRSTPASKPGDNVVMGVVLSNPDKPLWPDDGQEGVVTKLDLARYLETVGPWMMEHIQGRPCSVIRMPDGIEGDQRFFQRHAGKGSSALISEVQVFGDHKPYIQIDRIEALAALAQIGAVEYHPWNCQPFQPEVPGRLVFDLDPDPGIPFERVIEGALEVKARLDKLGLESFCKTTGGKGLHVVTPLKPDKAMDWKIAKKFAQDVCLAIAADQPDRYVVNMAKAKRKGRIFLDYLRNDRMSTAVAPLSPRGRPLAPVSFPLTWDQVKPGLDPMKWTIRTAPALLGKTKAWDGYCDAERPLKDAIRKLK